MSYCDTGGVSTKPRGRNRRSKLDEQDFYMILALKKVKPSTSLSSLQDKLSENSGKDVHKLKSDKFAPVARDNLQLAILKVLDTLSLIDIHGF